MSSSTPATCAAAAIDELRGVAEWIAGLPHRHKIIVAGNHDWCFVHEPVAARRMLGDAHYLEDSEITLDGQDGGVWRDGATVFANVTTWECERQPTVIDIDATTVTATVVPPHGRRDDDDQTW